MTERTNEAAGQLTEFVHRAVIAVAVGIVGEAVATRLAPKVAAHPTVIESRKRIARATHVLRGHPIMYRLRVEDGTVHIDQDLASVLALLDAGHGTVTHRHEYVKVDGARDTMEGLQRGWDYPLGGGSPDGLVWLVGGFRSDADAARYAMEHGGTLALRVSLVVALPHGGEVRYIGPRWTPWNPSAADVVQPSEQPANQGPDA